MKRFILFLLAISLFLPIHQPSFAEKSETSHVKEQVIAQTARSKLSDLTSLYLEGSDGYLIYGRPATFTVRTTGGSGKYEYEFTLSGRSVKTGFLADIETRRRSSNPSFTFTPENTSTEYLILVTVYDSTGKSTWWESEYIDVYPAEALDDAETVPAKVRQITDECLKSAGRSDYSRALWLHDWLIYNADYDTSYTYYQPDGVLLYGTGVCDSYTRAYNLLLREIGIECLRLVGTANGESHSWNLVRLNGNWYHIDCTWDDPIGGGKERHTYFALTDEQMTFDHKWENSGYIVPKCTSGDVAKFLQSLMIPVSGAPDFEDKLSQLVNERTDYAYFITENSSFNLNFVFTSWIAENKGKNGLIGYYRIRYSSRYIEVFLNFDNSGLDTQSVRKAALKEHELRMSVGEREVLDYIYLPEYATEGLVWSSDNENVVSVENGVISAVGPGLTTVRLSYPNGSEACQVYVFTDDSVILPEGLQILEEAAFEDCNYVQTVRLPRSLTGIESRAFAACEGLLFVFFASADAEIAPDAFEGCENLTIYAPAGGSVAAFARENGLRFAVSEP